MKNSKCLIGPPSVEFWSKNSKRLMMIFQTSKCLILYQIEIGWNFVNWQLKDMENSKFKFYEYLVVSIYADKSKKIWKIPNFFPATSRNIFTRRLEGSRTSQTFQMSSQPSKFSQKFSKCLMTLNLQKKCPKRLIRRH